ncbi:uncharacterized protein LOC100890814 [Strongylocentrotus purpuratus]|uniref:THD domain-containing protein n=1 Tax=Strongylocentrotus purpuratus TaxID=7668 RepID=A0A7M7N9I7_STRPU|nr:uncharacterized protein LOC100890814 [Strongylocentrotus purpuratus]
MKPPLDTYQHPFKSSARRLPDIAEIPSQDQHDQYVPCRCYGFTEHCPMGDHQDSKTTSSSASRAPNRTSLMPLGHYHISKTHTRTHARGAAKFVLTLIVVGVLIAVVSAMAYRVASLSNTQAHLLERVTLLEHRLAEVDEACECGRGATKGERGQKNLSNGERRNNKFAFIMTQGHAKLLEGETEPKPVEDLNPLHELKEVLDTVTPEIHPKVLIRLEEARSTLAPPQTRDPASTNPASLDDTRAPPKRMPVISQHSERTGRFKRGNRRKGRPRDAQEETPRARAAPRPGDSESNSTEIKGVHFQANLNRTTTIGVAGWVPYWALSSSILNAGSSDRMDEIKSEFRLSARGNVTVRTPGLYYVYSQMMYYDPNEYIGHSIVIDGVEAFTCIAPIAGQTSKYKTCFIGGLVYIPPRAKVGIKMLYAPRRVCLFEDTSYFGMFRVT